MLSPPDSDGKPGSISPVERRLRLAERALLFGSLAIMLALVLWHRYLPMNDTSSHIANAVIARGLQQGDPFFAAHYQMQAVPLPYWMAALLQLAGQRLLAPLVAYRLVVAGYLILLPLAFLSLCRAATDDGEADASAAPYAAVAALCGFNWAYHLGEINFILGQPFLLLAFAAFLRLGRPGAAPRTLVAFVALAVAVYLCHIYALSALLACLGCALLLRLCGARGAGEARLPRLQVLALAVAVGLFALAAYLVFLQHGTSANRGAPGFELSPRKAAHLLIDPFDSPTLGGPARGVVLVLVLVLLLAPVASSLWSLWQRRAGLTLLQRLASLGALPVLVPGAALWLLAYAGPAHILGADGSIKEAEICTRFTLSGALLLLAGLRLPPRLRAGLLLAMALLCVVKLRDAVYIHGAYDQRMRAVSAELLARVPERSRLLPLMDLKDASMVDYLYHRVGNYVVVERHGYSPHVFAVLGQHALRHRRGGDYRQVDDLVVTQDDWAFYDYVLIQTEALGPAVPGLRARAELVHRAAGFALYRVRR